MSSDYILDVKDEYIDCGVISLSINERTAATMKIPKSDVDYTQIFENKGGTLNITSIENFDVEINEYCKLIYKFQKVYDMILKDKIVTDDKYANSYSFQISDKRDVSIDDIDFGKLSSIGKNETKILAYNFYESFEDSAW